MSSTDDMIRRLQGQAGIRSMISESVHGRGRTNLGIGIVSSLNPNVQVSGQQSIQAGLALLEDRILQACESMSRVMAERISAMSQELVPVDSGRLHGSHFCRPLADTEAGTNMPVWRRGAAPWRTPTGGKWMRDVMLWEVGYDTTPSEKGAPHAVIVHENPPQARLGGRPMTIKPPGVDHFLQRARDEEGKRYPEIAKEEVVKKLHGLYQTLPGPAMVRGLRQPTILEQTRGRLRPKG